MTSVIVRQLHKILARRICDSNVIDERQRCMDDGCSENIAVLAALLDDSRHALKEIHIVGLDVAKAFDSVSHLAIPRVEYVSKKYARSYTVLECNGHRSEKIQVARGVRQGDPMSMVLFALVMDMVLSAVPKKIGYPISGHRINAVAYADDLEIKASSEVGMRMALKTIESAAKALGLVFNSRKSIAISLVPSGKDKKIRVLTEPQFQLDDGK